MKVSKWSGTFFLDGVTMVKVNIIGSSIAGLSVATALLSSKEEVNVTVYDKKSLVGQSVVCAGGISSYMIKKLNLTIPSQFIAARVNKVRFYAPNMRYAEVSTKSEYGLILWRGEWEMWLAERIKRLGGVFRLGETVTKRNFPLDADVVVGADGITGVTRKVLGLKTLSPKDVHIAIQSVAEVDHPQDTLSLWFGRKLAPSGYGWCFPEGASRFRVGLGVTLSHSKQLFTCYEHFLSQLNAHTLEIPRTKLIPTAKPMDSLVFRYRGIPVLLVGDAGLQTDSSSGAGIAPAIMGARAAAKAVLKGNPALYDKLWRRQLYRRNRLRYVAKTILAKFSDDDFNVLVNSMNDLKVLVSKSLGLTLASALIYMALKHPNTAVQHSLFRRLAKNFLTSL